jgi:hypothetical protein
LAQGQIRPGAPQLGFREEVQAIQNTQVHDESTSLFICKKPKHMGRSRTLLPYWQRGTRRKNRLERAIPGSRTKRSPACSLVLARHVVRYANSEREVVLLSIRHERQLGYGLPKPST